MLHAHVSLACKTRAHKQDMETSGSDSELERESGLDQASGSTSAIPTTNSDTSTASSSYGRLYSVVSYAPVQSEIVFLNV